jgi:hypothetical protein
LIAFPEPPGGCAPLEDALAQKCKTAVHGLPRAADCNQSP